MSYQAHIDGLDQAVAALDHMANHPDYSGKVVNVPVRRAMKSFADSIRTFAPRQALAAAQKMRSYPLYANFPRLYQRIGSSFKGAGRKKEAIGKAGVNVKTKKGQWAPQGTWTAKGTANRWLKEFHQVDRKTGRVLKQGVKGGPGDRGKINKMGFVPAGVAAVAGSVLSTLETDVKQRFLDESTKLDGSPFRKR